MQLSELIGKQIYTPAGDLLGYISGAYLTKDLKKISAYACVDAEEEEFSLSARAVCAVKDVVIARDRRLASPSGLRFPAGASAYSDTGETLGTVCDYRMDEDAPALVICSGSSVTEIPANRAAAGESVIVYPDAAPKRTASGAPRTKRKAQRHAHAREETPHAPDVASDSLAPPVNHLDLLGRTVKRTVYGANGEALIPTGTRILPPVLLLARRHGRLLSLAVNTLTNLP